MYRHSHRNRFRAAVSCHGSTPWAARVANEIATLCISGPSGGGVGGLACLLLVVACLLCLAVPASAEEGQPAKVFEMPDGVQYVPGEVLVCVDPEAAPADVEASLAQADEVLAREPSPEEITSGVVSVQVEDGAGVEDAVNSVLQSATSAVTGAQPNYVYYLAENEPEPLVELLGLASVGVDDKIVSEQWALKSMRAFDAWGIATCEGRVAVAVSHHIPVGVLIGSIDDTDLLRSPLQCRRCGRGLSVRNGCNSSKCYHREKFCKAVHNTFVLNE